MPADLETIVQRMMDAGEPEANIAIVIQSMRGSTLPPGATRGMYPQSTTAGDPITPRQRETALMNETLPVRMGRAWFEGGPRQVAQGVRDIGGGEVSRGANRVLRGGAITALPAAAPYLVGAAMAAPALTAAGLVAGTAGAGIGGALARSGATALGATPDQSDLAGTVGEFAVGGMGGKLGVAGLLRAKAARVKGRDLVSTAKLMKAIPPTKSTPYTRQDVLNAGPHFDVEHVATPIQGVERMRDAADSAIGAIESHITQAVQAYPVDLIRTNPLAAVNRALAGSVRGDARRIALRELDDLGLDQPITTARGEMLRRQLNAENTAILKKNNYDRYTARVVDPSFAAREAAAEALRDGVYGNLEARGVSGVRQLRRSEGSIIKIRNAAEAKIYQGEARVSGTGTSNYTRRLIGGAMRLVPGKIAFAVGDRIAVPNQTRDALIRQAFEARIPRPAPQMSAIIPPAESYVGATSMAPMQPERLALPPGARQMPPPPDPSGVRAVPGEYARREVRGLLPRGETLPSSGRVTILEGEVLPEQPARVIPAAPIAYGIDPTVKVKPGGVRVAQFSGDPEAAKAAVATPEVRSMLQRMLDDLDIFEPQRGKIIRVGRGGEGFEEGQYVHGVAGSPVGDDVRVISEQNVGNFAIKAAIQQLLKGKYPTNRLHTAALDAAMGYLERRPGYRGPTVPAGYFDAAMAERVADDAAFEAFSKSIDDLR